MKICIYIRKSTNHQSYERQLQLFKDYKYILEDGRVNSDLGVVRVYTETISGKSDIDERKELTRMISYIKELKKDNEDGETIGGLVRAPIWFDNPWGGMFFYAGHLVEALLEIYGRYPNSVKAYRKGKGVLIVVNYENYNITGLFSEDSAHYYAARYTKDSTKASELEVNDPWFRAEFNEFYDILVNDGEVKISYKDFVAPVFVMNAIYRSLESGKEEKVERYEI